MPAGVCDTIDKIQRRFLWGGDNENRKPSLVKWEIVCTPKASGGLGIRSTMDMNKTLISKLRWKLCSNEPSLWVDIIKAKYLKEKSFLQVIPKADASYTWKSILWTRELMENGVIWSVQNGAIVRFWKDTWLHDQPLYLDAIAPLSENELNQTVRDLWNEDTWNWDLLQYKLPEEILDLLALYSLSQNQEEHDIAQWKHSNNGIFTTKLAYTSLVQEVENMDSNWTKIWNLCVLPKK